MVMAKGTNADEVSIVRFFETGPIEKAEVVFNIVADKMRERLASRSPDRGEPNERGTARKRPARAAAETNREEPGPASQV